MSRIIIAGRDLPEIQGTFLAPESRLSCRWKELLDGSEQTLVLLHGPSSAALAVKVWPDIRNCVSRIIYAGGTFLRGDVTPYAEASIYSDPAGMESLLNSRIPVVFCTTEAAASRKTTLAELALRYAEEPENFKTASCGVHVEYSPHSPAYGKLISDRFADRKYTSVNAEIVLPVVSE